MAVDAGQAALASDIIDSTPWYAASSAGSDTYAITLPTAPSAYATGQTFRFKADVANTSAATLNVNSLGAKALVRPDGTALQTGDIVANQFVEVMYDGTSMMMISPLGNLVIRKIGITTRAGTTASGSQTIAHGLGRTPKKVKITVISVGNSGGTGHFVTSVGAYDGSTQSAITGRNDTSGNAASTDNSATLTVYMVDDTNRQEGSVAVDATNITITWTKVSSGISGTMQILWEAEA